MNVHDDKIAKLPAWAREHIQMMLAETQRLRQQLGRAEKQGHLVQARCDAMYDLMGAAARGGHETAKEFVGRVMSTWSPAPDG